MQFYIFRSVLFFHRDVIAEDSARPDLASAEQKEALAMKLIAGAKRKNVSTVLQLLVACVHALALLKRTAVHRLTRNWTQRVSNESGFFFCISFLCSLCHPFPLRDIRTLK